jgi:hypothetical protein
MATVAERVVVLSFTVGCLSVGPDVDAGQGTNESEARQPRWTIPGARVNTG